MPGALRRLLGRLWSLDAPEPASVRVREEEFVKERIGKYLAVRWPSPAPVLECLVCHETLAVDRHDTVIMGQFAALVFASDHAPCAAVSEFSRVAGNRI